MMQETQSDFYQNLRERIKDFLKSDEGKTNKFAEFLLLVPDMFHLLCKLTIEKEVAVSDKAKIAVAIAYFVSPIDLMPEGLIGPVGYLDDIALAAFVLNSVINNTSPEVVKKHWVGECDILEVIQEVLKVADEMIGSGIWRRIKEMF